MMRFKCLGGALVSAILLLVLSTVAGATLLGPSSTVIPVPVGTETGTLVATAVGSYNATNSIAGTVIEGVYSETPATSGVCTSGTCLDFVYQFTETNANHGVFNFTASDFDNAKQWLTDVYQTNNNSGALSIFSVPTGSNTSAAVALRGGMGPDQFTLTGGDTISYGFNDGGTVGESYIFIVKTNATRYVPGSTSLISNKTVTSNVPNLPDYQPWGAYYQGGVGFDPITTTNINPFYAYNHTGYLNTFLAPIPEPGFYGVLAIGLAILFVAMKYRREKQSA